ncbi:MAG: T9SS type A sorting domain-containing protein [bacterium]|nr:T9SS type A sorting domain-containing protein [bacterium]
MRTAFAGALPLPEISVNCDYFPVIVHGRGGPSAYAFQMGDPGGPVVWQAKGTLEYCDVVTFLSNEITTVELPYSLGVSLVAAESFGNPEVTRGFAKATITGSVDGHLVLAGADSVESESVTPTETYLSSSGTVPVAVGIGQTQVTIRMSADVYIEAAARSAGLWGLLSGSATAAALWPDSFILGNFQGPGGTPLQESLRIESAVSGMVYKDGGVAAHVEGDAASPAFRVQAFPNPGGGAFSLHVDVPGSDPAHVKIYDLRGHLVREIARGLLGNDAVLTWDGKDDAGVPVASGVYHAIVSTAAAQRAAKIVVQR